MRHNRCRVCGVDGDDAKLVAEACLAYSTRIDELEAALRILKELEWLGEEKEATE